MKTRDHQSMITGAKELSYRRDGVVVRASASQSVDRGFIS